jgi:hypothetical protein
MARTNNNGDKLREHTRGRAQNKAVKTAKKRGGARKTRANSRHTAIKGPMRRILAERTIGRSKSKEYLVDWYPTWELASQFGPDSDLSLEWKDNLAEHTFFTDRDPKTRVYKGSNPTEDVSAKATRLMLNTVLIKLQQWLQRTPTTMAEELFKDDDWEYASGDDERTAVAQAEANGEAPPKDAVEVMRRTYLEMRDSTCSGYDDEKLIYANVDVRYLGQIHEGKHVQSGERMSGPAIAYLQHLIEPIISEMAPDTWRTNEEKHKELAQLYQLAKQFVLKAPYLLKRKHIWPLFFVRLFFKSDELTRILNNEKNPQWTFPLPQDWADESRNHLLQTYIATFDFEQRPMDCVERTYLELRERVKWHVTYANVAEEGEGQEEEPTELSDEEDRDQQVDDEQDDPMEVDDRI